jgi:hypothetical protein
MRALIAILSLLLAPAADHPAPATGTGHTFYVPENAQYTITASVLDSLRFTLGKTLRRDASGRLISISTFVDPDGNSLALQTESK